MAQENVNVKIALQEAIIALSKIALRLIEEREDEEEPPKKSNKTLDAIIDEAEEDAESIEETDVVNRVNHNITMAEDIIAARGMIGKIGVIGEDDEEFL